MGGGEGVGVGVGMAVIVAVGLAVMVAVAVAVATGRGVGWVMSGIRLAGWQAANRNSSSSANAPLATFSRFCPNCLLTPDSRPPAAHR